MTRGDTISATFECSFYSNHHRRRTLQPQWLQNAQNPERIYVRLLMLFIRLVAGNLSLSMHSSANLQTCVQRSTVSRAPWSASSSFAHIRPTYHSFARFLLSSLEASLMTAEANPVLMPILKTFILNLRPLTRNLG